MSNGFAPTTNAHLMGPHGSPWSNKSQPLALTGLLSRHCGCLVPSHRLLEQVGAPLTLPSGKTNMTMENHHFLLGKSTINRHFQ